MEATRVIMTPLGSAASNVFNMLNMSFFLVFSTEALGVKYYDHGACNDCDENL